MIDTTWRDACRNALKLTAVSAQLDTLTDTFDGENGPASKLEHWIEDDSRFETLQDLDLGLIQHESITYAYGYVVGVCDAFHIPQVALLVNEYRRQEKGNKRHG